MKWRDLAVKFDTARDKLHGLVVWGFIFILAGGLFFLVLSGVEVALVPVLIMLALIGFLLSIWFGTSYTFLDDYMLVRFGVIKEKIYYHEITNIEHSRSILSSYALSRERLALFTNGKIRAYISPMEKEEFLSELNTHIDLTGFSI